MANFDVMALINCIETKLYGENGSQINNKIDTYEELGLFNTALLEARDKGDITDEEYTKYLLGAEIDYNKELQNDSANESQSCPPHEEEKEKIVVRKKMSQRQMPENKRNSSWAKLVESYPCSADSWPSGRLYDARTGLSFDVKERILKLAQGITDNNYSKERMDTLLDFVTEAESVAQFMKMCDDAGINYNFKQYFQALNSNSIGDVILPDELYGTLRDKDFDTTAKPARNVAPAQVYNAEPTTIGMYYYSMDQNGHEVEITREEYEEAKKKGAYQVE